MSAILSFVRKDLRLLFWPWLGWMGLFGAKLALAAWVLTTPEFTSADNTLALRLNMALTGLVAVVGAVLVAWLVQADAPRRMNVFWRTRPLSGWQLLGAKAGTVVLLFGIGPVLVALPWWMFNGMGAADMMRSGLDMVVVHTVMFAPVFLIATVTDSLARAVLWSFVQYGVVICLPIFVGFFSENANDLERGLVGSRILVAACFVMLGLPWLIVWQYTRRATVVAVAGLVLMQSVAVMAWLFSPYNLLPGRPEWTESNTGRAKGITLQPATAAKVYDVRHRGLGPVKDYVYSIWPITGVPAGLVAYPKLVSFTMSSADGEMVTVRGAFVSSFGFRRIGSLLGMDLLKLDFLGPDIPPMAPPLSASFDLRPDEVDKLLANPPVVELALRVALARIEIVFNRPLAAGDWHTEARRGLRIVDVKPDAAGARVSCVLTQSETLLELARRQFAGERGFYLSEVDRDERDYLFQPETGVMYPFEMIPAELRVLGVGMRRGESIVPPRPTWPKDLPPFEGDMNAWRAGLRVARVVIHEEARMFLKGRTEALVIKDERTGKNGVAGQSGTETRTSAP